MKKNLIEEKQKNKFILFLNKNLYTKELLDKGLAWDKKMIRGVSLSDGYFCLELYAKNKKQVLELGNYLLYLKRIS